MRHLPPAVQRWLTLLLPPFAVLICCAVMVPRQNRLRQTRIEIAKADAQIHTYMRQLQAIKSLPPDPMIATLPMTGQEQSDFLRGLTALCVRSRNRIISVSSLAAPAPSSTPATQTASNKDSKDLKAGALPEGVLEINSSITFEGTFSSLRSFLAGLKQSRRLIGLNECKIDVSSKGYPILQTTVSVARYVDAPPEYQAAAKAAASGEQKPSS
jgi:hypothetical protein